MKFDTKTYFREKAYDDVRGFVIIETQGDRRCIAEKWLREEEGDKWVSYWVNIAQLETRLDKNAIERVGSISDEQFNQVLDSLGEQGEWRKKGGGNADSLEA
jgi:hypothetical protein